MSRTEYAYQHFFSNKFSFSYVRRERFVYCGNIDFCDFCDLRLLDQNSMKNSLVQISRAHMQQINPKIFI